MSLEFTVGVPEVASVKVGGIEALRWLPNHCIYVVYTDSQCYS